MPNQTPPFHVPETEAEIYRVVDKDGRTVLVINQQLFNVALQRYTEPLFYRTQW